MKQLLLLYILIPCLAFSQVQIGQVIEGETPGDDFGYSVSISANGNIVAVSSVENNFNRGHVRVYKKTNGYWFPYGQDINGENEGDYSGGSISLSADGNTLAVGEPSYNNPRGRVRVFNYLNGVWVQIGQSIIGEENNDYFGISLSLSSNGLILAVGATGNPTELNNLFTGHVRIFQLINNNWTQIGEDIDGEYANEEFGTCVSLSFDGNIIAIGAPLNDVAGENSGSVRIFENINNTWIKIGQDINGEGETDWSGSDISLSSNGNIIAIGALYNDDNGNNYSGAGHVRVFENINNNWTQIGEDIDGGNYSELLGSSVSLSLDGTIIAVGIPGYNYATGRVIFLKNINNQWIQIADNIDYNETNSVFGDNIDLSNDGSQIIIGATGGGFGNPGLATIYSITPELAILEVVEDILGNSNGINVSAEQLNEIEGVSGAIDGVNYTTALDNGTFVDESNPTAAEIQLIIDQVNATLSINDNNILNFNLYPNPTKSKFTIQLENSSELQNVNIYNNLGQLVLTSKEAIIDSSKLTSGLYVVEIETNKGRGSKKLIIE